MTLWPFSQKVAPALDVGARDGFISRLLAGHFPFVTALDLELPSIDHERVQSVKGNIAALDFPDASFDLVFCAEVLEHIPKDLLGTACRELARVSKEYVLIGVPYKQDIRVGRTMGCCRFQRHFVKVVDETGDCIWQREGNSAGNSKLKL